MPHGTIALVECPHCHQLIPRGRNSQQHAPICIANPVVFAATQQALDDGEGFIRTLENYRLVRGVCPGPNSLYDQLHTFSWEEVAQHFGLAFTRKQNRTINQPRKRRQATLAQAAALASVSEVTITVCGLPVCRINDYGRWVGLVLR